jgi:hypothetical protein
MPQPQPGQLDGGVPRPRVARLGDALVAFDLAAPPGARGKAEVGTHLTAVAEVAEEHLVARHGREGDPDAARAREPGGDGSVLARRARRFTGMLAASSTLFSMPRARSQRCGQKPSWPASKQQATRTGRPSFPAACTRLRVISSSRPSTSPPASRCWPTLPMAGECTATSQVERLSSSATNSVAEAVSVRAGIEGIASMRGLLVLVSGPEPIGAQPSVAP